MNSPARFVILVVSWLCLLVNFSAAENHQIGFTNNCGGGIPSWTYEGADIQANDGSVDGEINGGKAWLGSYSDCGDGGYNCGIVEFVLRNVPDNRAFINLSTDNGNHSFQYGIGYEFVNGCTGPTYCSAPDCPEAARSSGEIEDHTRQCATDWGIRITFC